jgi:hypothetical protein
MIIKRHVFGKIRFHLRARHHSEILQGMSSTIIIRPFEVEYSALLFTNIPPVEVLVSGFMSDIVRCGVCMDTSPIVRCS